jgi:uncharacterized membrane protein
MTKLRKYLIAGLLVWLPILATYFIVRFLVNIVDAIVTLIPASYRPDLWLGHHIPGTGLVLTIIIVFTTGIIATNFFGKKLFNLSERIVSRIPLVRTIYSATRQVVHSVLTPSNQSFSKVLMIEFPRKGIWSVGFLTNKGAKSLDGNNDTVTVFVPTAPNPTSGFMMIAPKDEVRELDISVEEAFKMIVSVGVIVPDRFNQPTE